MILELPTARFLAAEGRPPAGGKDVELIHQPILQDKHA